MLFASILESIHGGSYGMHEEGFASLDDQVQLFASPGAIKFPYPPSDAWSEKVLC